MVTCADVAGSAAPEPLDAPSASARRPPPSSPTTSCLRSERLQIFGDVDLLLQRSGLDREIDEFLIVCLVLVREILGHEITDHRNRIDDVFRCEGILDQVLARL